MPTYRDQAIVLRTQKLGEADRIITLLSRDHGRIRTVAKGIRKSSSRFGARLEPLNLVDIQIHSGKGMDIVTQVETMAAFGANASQDYALWTAGQAMAETAERLTPIDEEPSVQQFLLLLGGLRTLISNDHDPGLVLDAYLVRSMSIAGWASSFHDCAKCDADGPHSWFSISNGGVLCGECRTPGVATPALQTVELLGALLSGDWSFADASEPKHRREASGIVAASLQWHLERELRALKHVDRNLKGVVRAE